MEDLDDDGFNIGKATLLWSLCEDESTCGTKTVCILHNDIILSRKGLKKEWFQFGCNDELLTHKYSTNLYLKVTFAYRLDLCCLLSVTSLLICN